MTATLLVLYGSPDDPAAFDAHYAGTHLPLVKAVPGIRTVTRSAGPVGTPEGPAPWYQVGRCTWDSMPELQRGLGSPEGAAAAADLPGFASGGVTLLVLDEQEA